MGLDLCCNCQLLWPEIGRFKQNVKKEFATTVCLSADALAELPCNPCIIIVDEGSYKISVDEVAVNHTISCPLVAVSYVFSLFYVLNIMYPKGAALTLEFIQRSLLGINPERGSKAEKQGTKQYNIPPKLLRFLSDLSDFQNPWKI